MSGLDLLLSRVGRYEGSNAVWLSPAHEPDRSQATASVLSLLRGRFARLDYTWAYEGKPQEGSLTFGHRASTSVVTAVWIDSWHMGDLFMFCSGSVEKDGAIIVQGTYEAPPGPPWGWRTEIAALDDERLRLRMFNITPEGEEALAVETILAPVP